jgi:3-mercaptopyruvate sulfurtransferase SseA
MYRQYATQVNNMSKVATIVSVKWLAEKVAAPPKNFRILDGSWHLPSAGRVGKDEYAKEHIPGAQFFDIDECADPEATTLNHMLPKPAGKIFFPKNFQKSESSVIPFVYLLLGRQC